MARLEDDDDEVWELRIWDTKPQLRFFGRFADRNVFIALIGPVSRWRLFWQDYEAIKDACKGEWARLFGARDPVTQGDDIDAYLTNVNLV